MIHVRSQSRASRMSSASGSEGGNFNVDLSVFGLGDADAGAKRGDDETIFKIEDLLRHPRFACGQIFTPMVLGTVLARTFYMPGIIEVMHALLMLDFYGQHSRLGHWEGGFLWQIRPP